MPKKPSIHISPNKGNGEKWKITRGGKTLSTHKTQKVAESVGRSVAKKKKVELVTHGKNGKIRSKDSFGKDSPSIKDKEH